MNSPARKPSRRKTSEPRKSTRTPAKATPDLLAQAKKLTQTAAQILQKRPRLADGLPLQRTAPPADVEFGAQGAPTPRPSRKKLKIGFVFDDTLDNPDGIQQYITTLGDWYTAHGHDVRYLVGESTNPNGRTGVYSLARNMKVQFNKNRMSMPLPANKEAVREVLQKEQFDVLHVQLPCSPFLAGRIVSMADPATVIIGTFHIVGHHWLVAQGSRLLGAWQRKMHDRFDHIVCVSTAAADYAEKYFGLTNTSVLPNVIDRSRFMKGKPIPRIDDEKINIIFLGRLVERKGCRYLIEAVRRLRDRGAAANLRVLICGKGPLADQLMQLVHNYKLEEIITFEGFIAEADKPDYLASADIAVFPSTGGESFGIVLAEAMAAGSDVVMGGDNVGYRSVLGPQANHVMFNPHNTQVFADKIQLLLKNRQLRNQIHAWQEEAVTQYDVETVAPKLLQLYQQRTKLL